MFRAVKSKTATRPESLESYIARQVTSLFLLATHVSVFWHEITLPEILLLLCAAVAFPLVLRFTPRLNRSAIDNLLIDVALEGLLLSFWGFNPYLIAIYVACSNMIILSSGGIVLLLRSFVVLFAFSVLGGIIFGFYYRADITQETLIVFSVGLLAYMTLTGMSTYNIKTRLRVTRNDLKKQKAELINLNKLALVVNTHLDVNEIMDSVMQAIEKVYSFESMYMLSLKEDAESMELIGVYGSIVTEAERQRFKDLSFDLVEDKDSIFVQVVTKIKSIVMSTVNSDMVFEASAIDRKLFSIKPCLSLACFPVLVGEKVVGCACFINHYDYFSLSESDVNEIKKYLVQVGTAVSNAALFDELIKTKEQAISAQVKAEASEEVKSRFLANMSHEIRTPLTAIMGYSEALKESCITEGERNKFIGHILRGGQHLLAMINGILDISKIEAGKIDIEKIECNIIEVLYDIESYMAIEVAKKGLDFFVDIEYPFPVIIYSDAVRLKQVLFNLCNNAIKFTEKGGITVHLRIIDNEMMEIKVKDTGIGIDDAEKAKIFNAFDQADTSTTRVFGGTGLGLYISKGFAELLGGNLVVNSEKGIGSTFVFTTPIYDADYSSHRSSEHRVSDYIGSDEELDNYFDGLVERKSLDDMPKLSGRVLVAEDNIENQNIITRLIKKIGMEVDLVDDGLQAVKAAQDNCYSVILLDMQMPVMGGKAAAELIRSKGIDTPLVAFTANVMRHQIDEYKALGFSGVLEKPINNKELFNTIKKAMFSQKKFMGKRILIVEDNDVNRMILYRHVISVNEHFEVVQAKNGQEALEKVAIKPFDLILMDMEMPIMGGVEATETLRKMGCQCPIFIVSGNVDEASVARCMAAGASGSIGKPFAVQDIVHVIEQNL